jgi:aryl carrier-like protein
MCCFRYLNDQVKTAEKLLDNPWAPYQNNPMLGGPGYLHSAKVYRTGDRARVRPDGQLEILGRADSTVKIRAFKVGLGMVENSIAELEGVGSAVVSTVLDESTKQPTNLVAYIVGDKGIPTVDDLRALRLLLAARLPDYAVPVYWYPLAQFPQKKGESRKLDRGALPPPGREHDLSKGNPKTKKPSIQPILQTADESSVGAMETEMLQIFKSVLGTDDLLPSDNFFEMGGHSLMAATLVGQLNELGLTVAIVDLYQHPSVEALATRVLGATTALSQSLLVSRAPKRSQFGGPIAVVGIAGEFPRAPNVQRLWANLRDGVDAIRKIQPDEYEPHSLVFTALLCAQASAHRLVKSTPHPTYDQHYTCCPGTLHVDFQSTCGNVTTGHPLLTPSTTPTNLMLLSSGLGRVRL